MWLKEFSTWLGALIAPYDPLLKVLSYVIAPGFAYFQHRRNKRDRVELRKQAEELGEQKAEIKAAHQALEESRRNAERVLADLEAKGAEVEKLQGDLHGITEGSQELWKLRPPKRFPEYQTWMAGPGAKLITFGNLKGGVGKTTLAANFAAYISETRKKPVLLVDLDYQGSLSNMLMLAIGREEVESRVDWLFDANADLVTLDRAVVHLVPKLCQAWLVPANYTFAQIENKLLLRWLLQEDGGLDVRYRLARALLSPEVRRRYAAIIFDMPPRMTLGSINALVASHAYVVPTILDSLSVEAVGQFLTNMKAIKSDLSLDIDLAGIVGMMARQMPPTAKEQRALSLARDAGYIWKEDIDYVFEAVIPRRVAVADAAGEDIAYFLSDAQNIPIRSYFDPLFKEICAAVWKGDGP